VSIARSLLFPQTTNQNRMFRSRNAQRPTLALRVANPLSSLLIKSCGSETSCTVLSSTHTRFVVPTDSVFVMTLGTLIGPLGSTSRVFSYLYWRLDPTFSLNRGYPLTTRWNIFPSSRSRALFGTQRSCNCPARLRLPNASSTVYRPLCGIYGRNRRRPSLPFRLLLTAAALPRFISARFSWMLHLR
jgi:hypothetical protein